MSRERLLTELADEAQRSLPHVEATALVAEARDHLEDDVQARLELGATPEEAERQAVAAFGEVRAVAGTIVQRVEGRLKSARVGWLGGFYLLLMLYSWAVCRHLDAGRLADAPFGALVGFAWVSFRIRHPAPILVVAGGLVVATILATAMGIAAGTLGSLPSHGVDLLIFPCYTGTLDLIFARLGALAFAVTRRARRT